MYNNHISLCCFLYIYTDARVYCRTSTLMTSLKLNLLIFLVTIQIQSRWPRHYWEFEHYGGYSVLRYLQLFGGALMFYLRYMCFLVYSGVYCVPFLFGLYLSCVPYATGFSGLSIFDGPFGIF